MILLGVPIKYEKHSILDNIAESYAGPHDMLNKPIWYDENGNAINRDGTITGSVGETSNYTNVIMATPFALATLLPPEVFNAIVIGIQSTH